MYYIKALPNRPDEFEAEKASNSYVISLVSLVLGMPLPIINLICSLIFYLFNRNSTYFVRWHCTQMLVSQIFMFIMNSLMIWVILYYILSDEMISLWGTIVIGIVLLLNVIEMLMTIISAIYVRKGEHIKWYLHGKITDLLIKK